MALEYNGQRIGAMQYNGHTIGEAMIDGQIVYRSAPAAVATLELGPETVQGYTFPDRTVYTVPEGAGGVYLIEAVATQTPVLSGASVQIAANVWREYDWHPDGGIRSRTSLRYLDSGVHFSIGQEFAPGDEVLLSAFGGAGSFVLHSNIQVFFLGPTQGMPRYTIDHTGGGADPNRDEWVTVHSTVVTQNSMTSGTWTVTWDRPSNASRYGLGVLLDEYPIAEVAPYAIGSASPTHQSVEVPENVVLEGQTIQFRVYADNSTATGRKIRSTRALLS